MIKNIDNFLNKIIRHDELENILNIYGGFHDALIKEICINNKKVIITVDDLIANFEGDKDYRNIDNVKLIFKLSKESKEQFTVSLNNIENIKIYDIELIKKNRLLILLSPSGKIEFMVDSLEILEN